MDFSDALIFLKEGQAIKRSSWENRRLRYGMPPAEARLTTLRKTILYENGSGADVWIASNVDILAQDWEVVKDARQT